MRVSRRGISAALLALSSIIVYTIMLITVSSAQQGNQGGQTQNTNNSTPATSLPVSNQQGGPTIAAPQAPQCSSTETQIAGPFTGTQNQTTSEITPGVPWRIVGTATGLPNASGAQGQLFATSDRGPNSLLIEPAVGQTLSAASDVDSVNTGTFRL